MQDFDNALLYYQKAIEVLIPEFQANDVYTLLSLEDNRINVDLIEALKGKGSTLLNKYKERGGIDNTKEVMVLFYQFLKEGYSKDVALQKAKITFLESKPLKQHPYYWAPFIQVGDPSPFNFDRKNSKLPFIILFAVLCGTLVLKSGVLRRLTSK